MLTFIQTLQTSSGEFMLDLKINKLGQWEGSSIKFQRHLTWKSETLHSGWNWGKHCPTSTLSNPNPLNPTFSGDVSQDLEPHMVKILCVGPKESSSLKASSRLMVSIPASTINKPYNLRQISQFSWALAFSAIKWRYWISKVPSGL